MATTLTIKNIPASLYKQLKIHAKQHHRSMNSDVIFCLEAILCSKHIGAHALLKSAREIRQGITGFQLTDAQLNSMKEEGRR